MTARQHANSAQCLMLAAMLALGSSGAAAGEDWAGVVKSVRGEVAVTRAGKSLPLAVGDRVIAGDRLSTGKDGQIGVTLRDDTRLSTGANSRIVITEFSFEPATQSGNVLVSLLRGVTAMISGLVARNDPQAMRVKTPTATIGIRGTQFVVEVDDPAGGEEGANDAAQ